MIDLDKNLGFLNEQQLTAVNFTKGSLLILAGAGSGKTRVLTLKIYHLLKSKVALPNQILAVTFTNKAANEMKSRVSTMINQPIDGWWIGTFHSLSAKILRRNAQLVGLKKNFVIIDQEDQLKLIKNICNAEKIDMKEKNHKYYLHQIEKNKNALLTVDAISKKTKTKEEKIVSKIYSIYEDELIRLNCCDFGNLILHCLYIFKNNKNILQQYQKQFKFILVDEYQDINFTQQYWLKYLYGGYKNICCVGDDDQSIYSWRGAEIKNILNFEKDFEKTRIVRLEQNYRSTQRILNCASYLIDHNKGRYGKTLWSKNDVGSKIKIKNFWGPREEAKDISSEIEAIINKKTSLNEIAILIRVAAHTRSFEERFLNIGLPYRIVGATKFYERREIKDVIAYLRITNNLSDDLAFERIINVPKRGIGQITIKKISVIARKNNISMFDASKAYLNSNDIRKNKHELNNFISKIHKWNKIKKQINHIELCELILDDSGYMDLLESENKDKDSIDTHDRHDNVIEFLNSLKEFSNLEGLLEHISLVADNNIFSNDDKINLMTMHSAKGLEFDYVFLVGWEEGLFPSKRSIEESGKLGLEEERRLAYVALTRAKKSAYISYVSQNRYSYASHDINIPSRFISELPKDDLEILNSEIFQHENYSYNFDEINNSVDQLTPGKKRLLNYNISDSDVNWEFNQDSKKNNNIFNEGERIFHKKFGYGRILDIDGETALINFEKTGTKMVFLKYLEKE